jgi:hypothetical protein
VTTSRLPSMSAWTGRLNRDARKNSARFIFDNAGDGALCENQVGKYQQAHHGSDTNRKCG